jgi:2-dehydropantoate 2-reductase
LKVVCIGAGAVGGTVAARLARAGTDLLVIDVDADHVALLGEPGIEVGGIDGGEHTRLRATTVPAVPPDADLILLAVRSHATRDALAAAAQGTADVVSLQNGLNEDTIADVVGLERTIGCVVGFGATWIAPGRVELNALGGLTIGRLDGSQDARLGSARDVLNTAFPTKISSNIRGSLWAKMLVNSMTVLGALGGMLTGDVLGTPERRRVVAGVVAEGVRVAHAEGVLLPRVFGSVDPALVDDARWFDEMEAALVRLSEPIGAIKSVTWRDFELGRKTEIDAVTGEIVRRGRKAAVPIPLSEIVYRLLQEIESGSRSPGGENLRSLETP